MQAVLNKIVDKHHTYKIPLKGVKAGKYQFEFELNDDFFQKIEGSEIEQANIDVLADVERHNNMMTIHFHLEGEAMVMCDRCLDFFYIPIDTYNVLSVRFSNIVPQSDEYYVNEDGEEDVLFADPNDDVLDIAHYLYESVCLSLPIQRTHPEDENGKSLCNPDVIKYLKQHEIE